MKQYYESELIKEIVEARGHKKSSLHYESECVESWIEEAKGAYPKLCDYESEWLNYISILDDMGGGEDPEPPIGEFPYVVLSDVTEATIDNVVPYAYKRAILKGKTDENLQSVKMPVLTTTGKNLFDKSKVKYNTTLNPSTGVEMANDRYMASDFINVEPNKKYVSSHMGVIFYYDENKKLITILDSPQLPQIFTTPNNCKYVRFKCWEHYTTIEKQREIVELEQLEEGSTATPYEPHKSNILTVNEDVTLRSNGNVYDELDLLTGKLTQRIAENGGVLSQEIIKTVDLNIQDQDGKTLSAIKPIEGTMFLSTSSDTIKPLFSGEIPVEAITQNLASFIDLEMEE